jgi:uncharacterized protein (TIGR01244 family)
MAGIVYLILLSLGSRMAVAQAPEKETIPGARSYTRIDATAAAGGMLGLEAIPVLKRLGFRAIINFRRSNEPNNNIEAEGEATRAAGMKFIHLPFDSGAPDPATIETFLKTVVDPANQPVFMHSAEAHRVGGMWLIKRVRVDGWSVDQALAEAERIGLNDRARNFALEYVKAHQ